MRRFAPASCRLLIVLLLSGVLSGQGTLLYAAPCDQKLTPIAGQVGYTAGKNRCAGFYVSSVSGPTLEIISLLRGPLRYDLKPQAQLLIIAPNKVKAGKTHYFQLTCHMSRLWDKDGGFPRGTHICFVWLLIAYA